jgi:hypothetical protein
MGGAALARVLHVTGRPLPSHRCHPIIVAQLPSSNHCPQIAAVIVIDIVTAGSGGGIIAIAVAVTIAIIVVILDITLLMSLCHCYHPQAPWWPIGGAGPNHATDALPMACGWCPYLWICHVGAFGNTRTLCP